MLKEFAISIIRTLRERGHKAYLVGGCVRDLLLGREPADYDVTTDALPEEVMRIFPETYAVGAQFGVVLIPAPEKDVPSKVSTESLAMSSPERPTSLRLRRFVATSDTATAAIPMKFGSAKIRVKMWSAAISRSTGCCLIRSRTRFSITSADAKTSTRESFEPLAILSYVSLKTSCGCCVRCASPRVSATQLRPKHFEAIRKLAPQIHQVSRERVRDELSKMLIEGHARQAFLLLDESGLLHEVLPEIEAMKGVEQPPQFHPEGDVFVHTLLLLDKLPHPCPVTLAWGALLHDVGKPPTFRVAPDRIRFDGHVDVGVKMAEEICERLHFSNDDIRQILALVDNHMRFAHVQQMKESTFKRFVRMPRFDEHLALHRMDCLSSHGDLTSYNFTREKMSAIPAASMRPAPLITGDDLISSGYTPGPKFKEILSAVEDAQLEGRLRNKEEALTFVNSQFPNGGQRPAKT